jgi:hypothetical protein
MKKYGGHLSKPNDWMRIPKRILKMGVKIESEHTNSLKLKRRIVADHWVEMGTGYYPALVKMENKLKKTLVKRSK